MLKIEIKFTPSSASVTLYGDGLEQPVKTKSSGYGYCKASDAMAKALNAAGVKLPKRAEGFGYSRKNGFKTGGIGVQSILHAFLDAGFAVIQHETESGSFVAIFKKSEIKNGFYN